MKTVIKKPIVFVTKILVGKNHSLHHRIIVGVIVMIVGVNIVSLKELFHPEVVKLSLDGVGYLLHGIGATPIVEALPKISNYLLKILE